MKLRRGPFSPDRARLAARGERGPLEERIRRAMKAGVLTLGMNEEEVTHIWGEPRSVETSGAPQFENQKWVYFEGLTEQLSLGGRKVVYFEGGMVSGWETQ